MEQRQEGTRGLLLALLAYTLWGLFPIYWKQLAHVSAPEVLAQRILWSFVFTAALLGRRVFSLHQIFRDGAQLRSLLLSTLFISVNWGLFILAVMSNRVAEASLGYTINPLLNVALARIFLGETLTRLQAAAVLLATLAVIYLTLSRGELPWLALTIAGTFSLYGLVKKRSKTGPLEGLVVETGLATPLAIGYLLFVDPQLTWVSSYDGRTLALLLGAGIATTAPLLAFAGAAQRLRYSTLGMVQYLAPSLQLGCAVLLYGEPFGFQTALTFGLLWVAVGLYVASALSQPRPG